MPHDLGYATSMLTALEFAAHKHRDQRRKGVEAVPYINHPIQVAQLLATRGQVDDLTTLVAAILHDTVEDTDTTRAEIEDIFGTEVANVVAEVTDDKSLPKHERKQQQVEHSPHLSNSAKQIKIADKSSNVADIGVSPPAGWDKDRSRAYFDWAEKVVAGCRGVNAGLEDYFDECLSRSRSRVG